MTPHRRWPLEMLGVIIFWVIISLVVFAMVMR